MDRRWMLAAALVPCMVSAAWADLSKATSISRTPVSGGGTFTSSGLFSNVTAIDEVYYTDSLNAAQPASVIAYTATMGAATEFETSLFLFLGPNTTAVTLTDIRFHSGAYDPATNTGANASVTGFAPVALVAGKNTFFSPTLALTLNNGLTTVGNFTRLTFFVNFTTAGTSTLQLDYIANPEPASMALMGLGVLGLGGYVWRRRRGAKVVVENTTA